MRGIAIGTLFLAYSMAIMQPFLPFVAFHVQRDTLADLFCINKDVPSCNGTCYLMSQVRQAPQQTDPATGLSTVRCLAPHIIDEQAAVETTQQSSFAFIEFRDPIWNSLDLFPEIPPPRA